MPQVPGPGQVCPDVIPAVTTVTATVPAIRTFIQAATALRRSQARVPLSLVRWPELWSGAPARSGAVAGSGAR